MWRVTWRNLFARKVRLLLSGFAIILGVAFVAGSFILTDTIHNAFTGIIKSSTADVEVAPTGVDNFNSGPDSRVISGGRRAPTRDAAGRCRGQPRQPGPRRLRPRPEPQGRQRRWSARARVQLQHHDGHHR